MSTYHLLILSLFPCTKHTPFPTWTLLELPGCILVQGLDLIFPNLTHREDSRSFLCKPSALQKV